ncbi:MAG: HVO_0476 family zinc finger protein [Candidatus Methanoperedens sp.]|nr:HVO_0476 family zinc finger protein [Candidatus Methanoperedens sp.]
MQNIEKPGKKVAVRVIVSIKDKSIRIRTLLSGVIKAGDELVVDDETTGEAYPVQVSSIEVGDKRKDSAPVDEIKTIWARAIEEVVVKIAISHRETTESIEMKVPGDREFIIGEKIKVDSRELKIIRIKIRDSGFKSRKGVAVKASDIKRIYAESGVREPRRFSKAGERIVIKKRESVWSLKNKKTD